MGAFSQPRILSVSVPGTPVLFSASGVTTPGSVQTVITSAATGAGRNLHQVIFVCRMDATLTVKVDGTLAGVLKSSVAEQNTIYPWVVPFDSPAGSTVSVEVLANSYSPAADFFVQLQCADK